MTEKKHERYKGLTYEGNEGVFKELLGAAEVSVARCAREHGFHNDSRSVGDLCALMHSEISELLEGLRHGNPPSDKIQGFSSAEEEAADILIRLLDTASCMHLRLGDAFVAKHKFNLSRPHMHGKKF